jgi:hypothetical protein
MGSQFGQRWNGTEAESSETDTEQRLWRTLIRRKYQLTCDQVLLQNQREALLEQAHIQLSSLVSDLLGTSARRMLKALADGETNPAARCIGGLPLAPLRQNCATPWGAFTELDPVYRRLVKILREPQLSRVVPDSKRRVIL